MELAQEHDPHIAVMDLTMPGLNLSRQPLQLQEPATTPNSKFKYGDPGYPQGPRLLRGPQNTVGEMRPVEGIERATQPERSARRPLHQLTDHPPR